MRRRTDITASDTLDGRTARSDRTHNAVVDAFLRLLDEGNLRPTTEQIAERAAVSPRSVYQHFPERDALLIAACEHRCRQALDPTPPIPAASSFDDRLTAVVEQRARVVAALTAAIEWPTWENLRAHQRLSMGEARMALQHLVASLLPR